MTGDHQNWTRRAGRLELIGKVLTTPVGVLAVILRLFSRMYCFPVQSFDSPCAVQKQHDFLGGDFGGECLPCLLFTRMSVGRLDGYHAEVLNTLLSSYLQ